MSYERPEPNFNPLPSHEGRLNAARKVSAKVNFNPLPSYEGRQWRLWREEPTTEISIHSPHTRGDVLHWSWQRVSQISIHSPHTRGDGAKNYATMAATISIHSPHTRGDRPSAPEAPPANYFNPLPSHEGRQHKPPKIHPDLRQLTQQNHDTLLFGALQAPFCGAEPDIRGAKPTGKP